MNSRMQTFDGNIVVVNNGSELELTINEKLVGGEDVEQRITSLRDDMIWSQSETILVGHGGGYSINFYPLFKLRSYPHTTNVPLQFLPTIDRFINQDYPSVCMFVLGQDVDIMDIISPVEDFFHKCLVEQKKEVYAHASGLAKAKAEAEKFELKQEIRALQQQIASYESSTRIVMPEFDLSELNSGVQICKWHERLCYVAPFHYKPETYGEYELNDEAKRRMEVPDAKIGIGVTPSGDVTHTFLMRNNYQVINHYHSINDGSFHVNCLGTYSPPKVRNIREALRVAKEIEELYRLIQPYECVAPGDSQFISLENLHEYLSTQTGWSVDGRSTPPDPESEDEDEDEEATW